MDSNSWKVRWTNGLVPVACEQPMALPPINGIIVAQRGEGVDEKVAVEVGGMKGVTGEVDIDVDVEE